MEEVKMEDTAVTTEEVKDVQENITEKPEEVKEEPKFMGVLGERLNSVIEKGAERQKAEIQQEQKTEVVEEKPDDELPPADEVIEEKSPPKNTLKRLEEKSVEELVAEVKKWTSIAEQRKVENERGEPNQKYSKFIDGLKTDFYKTYEEQHDEFGLPSISYLKDQISTSGDRDARIQQWQDAQLIPAIEKKFKLEPGTFVFDPQDLYKKGTPTETFRRQTADKEAEFDREFKRQQELKQETIKKISEQQKKDIAFLKDTYYIDREDAFEKDIELFNGLSDKLAKGELSEDKNPFSVRNIYRGFYFDELAEASIKKAIDDIHAQYNAKGLFLPHDDNGTPTDVTSVNGSPLQVTKGPIGNKYSQQDKMFSRYNK